MDAVSRSSRRRRTSTDAGAEEAPLLKAGPGPADNPYVPPSTSTLRRAGVVLLIGLASVALACEPAAVPPSTFRSIAFPVQGGASFIDSFGAPRGSNRTHAGQDLMAPKMRPALAAADGTVTWLRYDNTSTSGNLLVITDDDGWTYHYIHLNNDTPGTDDGRAARHQVFGPGIAVGAEVAAGQVVGYVGDSGNAEFTDPHLHFEMHRPDGTAVNPYESLLEARVVK